MTPAEGMQIDGFLQPVAGILEALLSGNRTGDTVPLLSTAPEFILSAVDGKNAFAGQHLAPLLGNATRDNSSWRALRLQPAVSHHRCVMIPSSGNLLFDAGTKSEVKLFNSAVQYCVPVSDSAPCCRPSVVQKIGFAP